MRFTVFTSTYNRAYVINRLYESLKRQSFHDFEWLVIDDGSTDETEELFKKWIKDKNYFEITYIKVRNGGKHRAINQGAMVARGELFFMVDSDDYLTDDALEALDLIEKTIDDSDKKLFSGICCDKGFDLTRGIGSFPLNRGAYVDITTLERDKYGISGDKSEVVYTRVLKQFPFPIFNNETFMSEGVLWNRIASKGLKMRFVNKIVMICNYLDDGLSKNLKQYQIASPKGTALFYREQIKYLKLKKKIVYVDYYYLFRNFLSVKKMADYLDAPFVEFCLIIFIRRIKNIKKRLNKK